MSSPRPIFPLKKKKKKNTKHIRNEAEKPSIGSLQGWHLKHSIRPSFYLKIIKVAVLFHLKVKLLKTP